MAYPVDGSGGWGGRTCSFTRALKKAAERDAELAGWLRHKDTQRALAPGAPAQRVTEWSVRVTRPGPGQDTTRYEAYQQRWQEYSSATVFGARQEGAEGGRKRRRADDSGPTSGKGKRRPRPKMRWSLDRERQLPEDERKRAEGLRGTAWRQAEARVQGGGAPPAKTKVERRKSQALSAGLLGWVRGHQFLVAEEPGGRGETSVALLLLWEVDHGSDFGEGRLEERVRQFSRRLNDSVKRAGDIAAWLTMTQEFRPWLPGGVAYTMATWTVRIRRPKAAEERGWYDAFAARWRAWLFQTVADTRAPRVAVKRPRQITGRAHEVAEADRQAKRRKSEAEEHAERRRWGKARAVPGVAGADDDSGEEDGRRREDGGRGGGVRAGPGRAEPGDPT